MSPQDNPETPIESVGGSTEVREQDKIMLILSYFGCLALIPLLTVKDSPYVKWHAKQGAVLMIGGSIALTVLAIIPVVGWIVSALGGPALMVLGIIGIVKALGGQRWRIPLVADLADKINV